MLRSQGTGLLVIPRIAKSTIGGRAFSYHAPHLWNKLPAHVRSADTITLFKARLKTYLFEEQEWVAGFSYRVSGGLSGQCCHWIIIGNAV